MNILLQFSRTKLVWFILSLLLLIPLTMLSELLYITITISSLKNVNPILLHSLDAYWAAF